MTDFSRIRFWDHRRWRYSLAGGNNGTADLFNRNRSGRCAGLFFRRERIMVDSAKSSIAVRPPEYFPGLAFMALLDYVDTFVLADTLQYSRQSFQNRARLRTPQGRQWISIPLAGGQHGRPVHRIGLEGGRIWLKKHARALMYNYRSSPYYEYYEPEITTFIQGEWNSLADLSCGSVSLLCKLLGTTTRVLRSSALPGGSADMASILDSFDELEYVADEAVAVYDHHTLEEVRIVHYLHPAYRQNFEGFEAGLSALDVLFNYGPQARAIIRSGIREGRSET